MKTYRGRRNGNGSIDVEVIDGDGRTRKLPLRLDLENHSPTGFEIGYGGSGPAQLALAILADVLNAPRSRRRPGLWMDENDVRLRCVQMHQDFKWKFIAGLPRNEPFTIRQQDVLNFVLKYEQSKGSKHHEHSQ